LPDRQPDPFAPLPQLSPAALANSAADEWEPVLPAPLPLPETISYRGRAPDTLWQYRDETGALLFAVCRFDKPGGKDVMPYCCGADGWRWKAPPSPRPLYGLDRLAAHPDATVLLVEGEKAAEAAASLFPAMVPMTWQGGSNATGKAEWAALEGRSVILWPDHDKPGREAMAAVAAELGKIGAAAVATVAVPSDWPEAWDLADPLPAGADQGSLAALLHAATAAEDAAPDAEAEIARVASLSAVAYAAERKGLAQRLGMGVVALDKAVRAAQARKRAEAAAAYRQQPGPTPGEVRWPFGFFMREDGLHADTGGDAAPQWIAGPFEVLGEARDHAGEGWGLWLRWRDPDSRQHTWLMPRRMLVVGPGELEAELVDRHLRIETAPDARLLLRRALGGVEAGNRLRVVSRAGWHPQPAGGAAYVLPDGEAIGAVAEPLILRQQGESIAALAATAGTLEDWQAEVAALAVGNPLAAFCIAAAFAAPLLEPLGEPSGGFHLQARSKTGKTMALRMACSVWGLPFKGGLLRDWKSTANALEAAAEDASDGLLALDEIHQAPPQEVAGAIYMIGNEAGRARLRRDASAARRRTWRTLILSTGEIDTAAMVAKAGQKLPAGAQVRLPSLPLDGLECWPTLHGRDMLGTFSTDLHASLRQQHGTAARAFLARLAVAREDEAAALQDAAEAMRSRILATLPADADPQVRDVARRFALVAVAGELAVEWGILPWPEGEAERAARTLLEQWRDGRGGDADSAEALEAVERVRLFLAEHGRSRFVLLEREPGSSAWREVVDPARPVIRMAGWRRPTRDGRYEYLIDPDVWRAEVCQGIDAATAARTLIALGHMEPGEGRKAAKKERVPGRGSLRVYVVKADFMGEGAT
jgi:uncharacterized protein (DUF927 family)